MGRGQSDSNALPSITSKVSTEKAGQARGRRADRLSPLPVTPLRESHTNVDFTIRTVISLVLSSWFLLRRYAFCLVWVGTTCKSVFRYRWSLARRGAISHKWGPISVTLRGGLKTTRYGLSVCVFSKFICRNPDPRGDGVRRWWGHGVGPSRRGLVPLQARPREFSCPFPHVRIQREVYDPEELSHPAMLATWPQISSLKNHDK